MPEPVPGSPGRPPRGDFTLHAVLVEHNGDKTRNNNVEKLPVEVMP
jgi:hypothetical protein